MSFHYFIHVWRGDNGDDDNAHQGRVHVDAKMPLFMNAEVHLYLDEINLNVTGANCNVCYINLKTFIDQDIYHF